VTTFLEIVKLVYAPLFTLLAGYFGMRYGLRQLRVEKHLDFVTRQLNEFYSPLLGFQKAIRAKSELRLRISGAANRAWEEICERVPQPFYDHEKEFEPFKRIIDYDNEQLRKELLPLYRGMLELFRDNYWLAEPETRKWFSELSDFVELWDRWITQNIPGSVIEKLDHKEARLLPFYEELETRLDLLRSELPSVSIILVHLPNGILE